MKVECVDEWYILHFTNLVHSRPRSNGSKGVLYTPQSSRIGASPSNSLVPYPKHSLVVGLPFSRHAVVSYSLCWLGCDVLYIAFMGAKDLSDW